MKVEAEHYVWAQSPLKSHDPLLTLLFLLLSRRESHLLGEILKFRKDVQYIQHHTMMLYIIVLLFANFTQNHWSKISSIFSSPKSQITKPFVLHNNFYDLVEGQERFHNIFSTF